MTGSLDKTRMIENILSNIISLLIFMLINYWIVRPLSNQLAKHNYIES